MKNTQSSPRLFAFITLGFVIATIIGTVSHELGHVAVAKSLGYSTTLHYASMNHDMSEKMDTLAEYYDKHKDKIIAKASPEKTYFTRQYARLKDEDHLIRWGGPLQTMLTGTVGAIVLWLRRKKIAAAGMQFADWFWVILAFFWSRQLANFAITLVHYSQRCKCLSRGDEAKISRYFHWPVLTLNAITGIIAAAILTWVVFYIIPKPLRLTFIVSGIAGSALGWLVWMEWIGPVVLP